MHNWASGKDSYGIALGWTVVWKSRHGTVDAARCMNQTAPSVNNVGNIRNIWRQSHHLYTRHGNILFPAQWGSSWEDKRLRLYILSYKRRLLSAMSPRNCCSIVQLSASELFCFAAFNTSSGKSLDCFPSFYWYGLFSRCAHVVRRKNSFHMTRYSESVVARISAESLTR